MGKYLGRRGGFLLLFGIACLAIALSLQTPPPSRTVIYPHEFLPIWARMIVWLLGAVASIASSPLRKPGQDRWGFILLCVPFAERAVSYLIGVIEALLIPQHYWVLLGPGLAGASAFSVMVGAILLVAGWPEPRPEVIRPWLYRPKTKGVE